MEAVDQSLWDIISKLPEMLTQLSALGWVGWVIGAVLAIGLGVGTFFIHKYLKDAAVKKSEAENEKRRVDAETKLPVEQAKHEGQIQDGREELRRRVEERMGASFKQLMVFVDVDMPLRGQYGTPSGMPQGAVVHYTAGRPVLTMADAKAALADMASRGIGALLIAADGVIYAGRNVRLKESMSHAGDSTWLGQTGLSRLCVGIEVACPGILGEGNVPWYGGAAIENPRVINAADEKDNVKSGSYARFTGAQEQSLFALLAWHAKNCPDFKVEWIVGHDEIAPDRKLDPGGSLSKTMPEVRELVRMLLA